MIFLKHTHFHWCSYLGDFRILKVILVTYWLCCILFIFHYGIRPLCNFPLFAGRLITIHFFFFFQKEHSRKKKKK